MEEAALLVAMAEADRGDTVSAADTLKQIRRSSSVHSISPLSRLAEYSYSIHHGVDQIHLLAGSRPVAWLFTGLP